MSYRDQEITGLRELAQQQAAIIEVMHEDIRQLRRAVVAALNNINNEPYEYEPFIMAKRIYKEMRSREQSRE